LFCTVRVLNHDAFQDGKMILRFLGIVFRGTTSLHLFSSPERFPNKVVVRLRHGLVSCSLCQVFHNRRDGIGVAISSSNS